MSRDTTKLTDTQKGTIGEYLISTFLILESNGRLSPAFTWADDSGLDLIAYDKETKKDILVQVKSRLKPDNTTTQFDVRKATFIEAKNSYIVAVLLDIESKNIGIKWAWLIPSYDLKTIAKEKKDKYVIIASCNEKTQDKCSPYRCNDMKELTRCLIKIFDEGLEK